MSKPWNPRPVVPASPSRRAFRRPPRRRGGRPAWTNGLLFLAGGGAALALSIAWRPTAEPGWVRPAPGTLESGAPGAVRVIDGDTFEFGGARIRIADIDTPEVHGRCPEESRLAAAATERMAALLADGPFDLAPIAGRDSDVYGRKLRIVSRGGRSLGAVLVAEGLAHPWVGHKLPWCR